WVDGKPAFSDGQVHLRPGDKFVAILPYDVGERTLEMWCYLPTTKHRAKHLLFIKHSNRDGTPTQSARWDGISYSDVVTGRFCLSSEGPRTREFDVPPESSGPTELLHLAAVYARDNTITLYRNGVLLGEPFRPEGANGDLVTYRKEKAAIKI